MVVAVLLVVAAGACGHVDTASSAGTNERVPGPTPTAPIASAAVTTTTGPGTTTPSAGDDAGTTSADAAPVATAPSSVPPSITGAPDAAPPPPAFAAAVSLVTATDLSASWRSGCPVPVEQLRALDVSHWGFDGHVHTGRLIVAANEAAPIVAVMGELYAQRYPIERMQPIDVYGGDDNRSISANNTSAFNCRAVTGGGGWSEHAYGRAIDVNPFVNPYVKGATVLPPEAAAYVDRGRADAGMIHDGDGVVQAFLAQGWRWGGSWTSIKDYQHFSTTGR